MVKRTRQPKKVVASSVNTVVDGLVESSIDSDGLSMVNSKTDAVKKNFSWTDDAAKLLLRLRLKVYSNRFIGTNARHNLTAAWKRITLDINSKFGVELTDTKVKNKYQSLKKAFRDHQDALKKTGNDPVPEPPHWYDYMCDLMGDRQGLTHDVLGEAGDSEVSEEDDDAEEEEDCDGNSTPVRGSSSLLQQSSKRVKIDLADAVASFGDSIKEGLVALASGPKPPLDNGDQMTLDLVKQHTSKVQDALKAQAQENTSAIIGAIKAQSDAIVNAILTLKGPQ